MSVEFVGIELQLRGAEGVYRDLKEIDKLLNSFGGRKQVKSGLADLKKEAVAAKAELDKLNESKKKLEEYHAKSGDWLGAKALEQNAKKIKETEQRLKELKQAEQEVRAATRDMGKTFSQTFKSISSIVAQFGGRLQTLGKTIGRFTAPLSGLLRGTVFAAGFKALDMMTQGFSGAFERADTMKNYSRTLEQFGFSAEKADEAVKELEAAVMGLPTGLDEIVAVQKRFVAASQDIEKSTDLAIAYNNAILASNTDARQQLTAQRIITQLAGGAEIAASSWIALQRAIPMVFTELSRKANMSLGDYVNALQKGKISTEEFMEDFIKIGTSGSVKGAALVLTKSWQGLSANITNRFKAMGQNVIETLHEVFKNETGRDLLETLLGIDAEGNRTYDGIRDWIDGISESVQEWIRSNPDVIIDFFETLKSIDVKGLLKGVAQGLGDMAGLIKKLADWASNKDLQKFGRFYAWLLPISKGLTLLGGLIRGGSPIAGFGGAVFSRMLSGKGGGFFGKIASFFGKKKDIEVAGDIGGAVAKASPKLLSAFENMALISGIVAMPALTAWGVTSAVKNSIKNFKETINLLKDMDWSAAGKVASGIAGFIGASAILGGVVGKFGVGLGIDVIFGEVIVGLITSIATGFFDLDMGFIKGGIKNFVDSVNLLKEIPDVESFGDVKTKISNAIEMMNEISALFKGRYVDKGVQEGGIQGIGFGTAWSISNFAKALAPMKDAVERINEIASMSISESAVDNIGKIIDAIGQIQSKMFILMGFGFGNIKRNLTKVADSMFELRRVIYHVGKLAGEKISTKGLENVTEAITEIRKAFDAKAIADIRGTITVFVTSIQEAFTELDKLNTPIEIKASVKLSKDFKTSVDAVVREIGAAKRRIQLAWMGIPTSLTKTVTMTLNRQFRQTGSGWTRLGGDDGTLRANGGMIYRSHGGGVPWKRRGTDTVPAMLTPGEYVHNRRAVNTFGIDFMRKVNNLDMKGAMNELMHRAGHMANINRGTNITNNNYNNQKVVINNSNAGAGYTFKTASRFVGAF